ncbi:UV DNA damage repair endonuclease UvsE [Tepidibacter hydrothermalis]|uniref:UV DNA damage repair endonuclease UvsE n=1 Tax=Tepidibacter hydrothermalis TaxID=3036126 RepID=A0ABY8EAB5_9FIRM|nr:UV DNA damage repair endonuclease UvsE [Tepidibacter hydrothermalis]WFD09845.1 UV DNA damage repair endonuclease UvsE [Tepidibacter hydrothermalis]
MIKNIGYACINTHLKPRTFNDCRLNSIYKYGINYLRDKIINNLYLVKDILLWNIKNDIYMYRVSSRLIPLVTHPDVINDFDWNWKEDDEILNIMKDISDIVKSYNIRLSMHPDQFTVLNSPNEKVVQNSIINIKYHYDILKRLSGNDMIIHTGGVYNDKKSASKRFIHVFNSLEDNLKSMIRLENDDKSFTVEDVLYISSKTHIPIVLDIHHHKCNNPNNIDIQNYISAIVNTWENTSLIPKLHISSGRDNKFDRKHSNYIDIQDLNYLLKLMNKYNFDMMVEAKQKDKSVLEIINILKDIP